MTNSIKCLLLVCILLPACKKDKNTGYVSPGIKKYTARMEGVRFWNCIANPVNGQFPNNDWTYPNGDALPSMNLYGEFPDTLSIHVLNDSMLLFLTDTFLFDYSKYPPHDSSTSLLFTNVKHRAEIKYNYISNSISCFYMGSPPLVVLSFFSPE